MSQSSPSPQPPGQGPEDRYPAPGAYGEYSGYAAAGPPRPTGPGLGRIALVAGAVALVGSVINAWVVIALLGPERLDTSSGSGTIAVTFGFVLAIGMLLWFGFGLWAIIQGAIAAAQGRGRPEGVIAIVLGLVGPWIGVLIAIGTLTEAWAGA